MRFILSGIAVLLCGYVLWYGLSMGMALKSCSDTHTDLLNKDRMRFDVTLGDHGSYCQTSYDDVVSWESCVNAAGTNGPKDIISRLRPAVYQIFRAMVFPGTRMDSVEAEHDDACKDLPNTMFHPPEMVK